MPDFSIKAEYRAIPAEPRTCCPCPATTDGDWICPACSEKGNRTFGDYVVAPDETDA